MKYLFLIFSVVLLGCSQSPDKSESVKIVSNDLIIDTTYVKSLSDTVNKIEFNSLTIIKEFATNYNPKENRMLPTINKRIYNNFRQLKNIDSIEYEKYLTLVFIKLYLSHLECCHQSYELRKQPPSAIIKENRDTLLFLFNEMTNQFKAEKPIEFVSSSIAYDWVKSKSQLYNDPYIKGSLNKIDSIKKNIEDQLKKALSTLNENDSSNFILSNGTYRFDLAFAEWQGKSMGEKVTVIINRDSIKVIYEGDGNLTLAKKGEIMDEGIIMKHKSGEWIIGKDDSDKNIDEIGGCTGGPAIIDFRNKKYWIC